MAMGLQQGLALACFDCAVTPLRATEQRPEEGDVQKVLLRCLEMAPEEVRDHEPCWLSAVRPSVRRPVCLSACLPACLPGWHASTLWRSMWHLPRHRVSLG